MKCVAEKLYVFGTELVVDCESKLSSSGTFSPSAGIAISARGRRRFRLWFSGDINQIILS
jgi:hypothetical protein